MYSVNRHTILGVIEKTPVLQELDGNKKLLTFHVTKEESYYDRNHRKVVQNDTHEVTIQSPAGGLADNYFAMLTKDSNVYVESPVKSRRIKTDDGEDRLAGHIVIVRIRNVQFMDRKAGQSQQEEYYYPGTSGDVPF